jgi:hypothetical protein
MTTMGFMAWVVLDIPFIVAFDIQNPENNGWDWHRGLLLVIDIFFMCDVLLNFNTGVEIEDGNGHKTVSLNRYNIFKDYMSSWFWVDIVSAFPLDLILSETVDAGDGGETGATRLTKLSKAGRIVRMFKLVRLLRIARAMRVITRLEYTMSTQETVRTLWKFFAVVVITCHLFTCVFYAIGVSTNDEVEWANGVDNTESVFDKYVAGFYWAIMTTTTIGKGVWVRGYKRGIKTCVMRSRWCPNVLPQRGSLCACLLHVHMPCRLWRCKQQGHAAAHLWRLCHGHRRAAVWVWRL